MKEIVLAGDVGWEITEKGVAEALAAANGEDIKVVFSTRGGMVSEGLGISNLFRNYKGHKTAVLSGFVMSMGSYISTFFDRVITEDNAVYMVHNVQGGVWGDHNDILPYGEMCKSLSAMLAKKYANFSGKIDTEIAALMDKTTFYFGDEIVEAGFAHEVVATDSGADETGAMATAKLMFQELTAKLTADQVAMKKDLSRASAMAFGDKRAIPPQPKKEPTMDRKELEAKYPELVAAITQDAVSGKDAEVAKAKADGAKEERERIQAVHAQTFPGHEVLVAAAMFDGKSTPGDVAMQINAANLKLQAQAGEDLSSDAPAPVKEPLLKLRHDATDDDLPVDEKCAAEWKKSKALRAEFNNDLDSYVAFKQAEEEGSFKYLKNKEAK